MLHGGTRCRGRSLISKPSPRTATLAVGYFFLTRSLPIWPRHAAFLSLLNVRRLPAQPSKFHIYKIFEPGLTNATTAHPCHDHKYSNYSQTVTHGFGPIKMTLDLYKPDEGTVIEEEVGSGAFKDLDAKAVGCCGKKITGGEGAVSDCMVKLCSSAAYKPNYCGEDSATQKKIGDCTGAVSSCSLKKCALHCLAGSCNDACTSCVKSNCDTDVEACLNPLGWEAPRICDTSLPTC